jgi:hypothetical protein
MAKLQSKTAISADRLRAYWANRQGLGAGMKGESAGAVLARTGWARSVGGCNPYLALRDRAGLSRAQVDQAVARLEIHELPSARGCTYVVPKEDYAVALRASQGHGDDATMAMATKYLGVTVKEVDKLRDRVLTLLTRGPLDPAAIKEQLGDAVRSLGAEGKKRGTTSTLPLALGYLQTRGLIRRIPVDGRLDQQRYRYAAWSPSPLGKKTIGDDELAMELGRRFFRWAGPATVTEFSKWAGLGMKVARAAAAELKLVPLEGEEDERLLFPDDREALLAIKEPKEPAISFVSLIDNLVHFHRDLAPRFDAKDAERAVAKDGKKVLVGALADLPYHPIVDRGRIVGLWDWDGVAGKLAWRTFSKNADVDRRVAKEGDALAAYVKSDLGDVRSFSLDNPEKRGPHIEALLSAKW